MVHTSKNLRTAGVTFVESLQLSSICVYCLLLLSLDVLAQEVSFHITPLQPVSELREKALKVNPPHEPGSFRTPDLIEC